MPRAGGLGVHFMDPPTQGTEPVLLQQTVSCDGIKRTDQPSDRDKPENKELQGQPSKGILREQLRAPRQLNVKELQHM